MHSGVPGNQVGEQVHNVYWEDVLAEQPLDLLKLGVVGQTLCEYVHTDHVGHRAHHRKLRVDWSGSVLTDR